MPKKIIGLLLAVFLGFFLFFPFSAKSADKSCCRCSITKVIGGQPVNTLRVFKDITDAQTCTAKEEELTGGDVVCAIGENEECNDETAPVTTDLTEEFNLKEIDLGITIPGLRFSAPPSQVDEEGNIYFPWIGEYIAAIYNFAIVVISILAVVMIIVAGIRIITSAGGPAKGAAYKKIGQAVIGLFIAWGSYVILYTINPNTTLFRSLSVKYVESEEIDFASNSEESIESSSQTPAEALILSADQLWETLEPIKGENMVGKICKEKSTCGRADPTIAKIFKEAAQELKNKGCVVIYAASARKATAQLDKVKKRCVWNEKEKTYVDCGVALGRWGTTEATVPVNSKVCRYLDPDTPLPPCDINTLLHYKAIDAWAANASTAGECKELGGTRNCACTGKTCLTETCQRELIRQMNARGACVLLGKAKNADDRSFEPWHFEMAGPQKASFCFTNADQILNSLGGEGF